jgi:hypothetical protein|tara:strand:- start:6139 stop:6663 length:525 start_codon:yes stop_codon:yes gene_type:complete
VKDKDSKLLWEAYTQQEVIEEGVKDIMLGVLCALGISCSSMMQSPTYGTQMLTGWPTTNPGKRAPKIITVNDIQWAKPNHTFEAALNRTSLATIKNPEMRKSMTDLMLKEIETWFNENPKAANRLKQITGSRELKDKLGDISTIAVNWGPEPEHGWPGWNEVMKKVESAIAQPK